VFGVDGYGWHVQTVADGNDLGALARATEAAKAVTDRPSLVIVRTEIGYGSPKQGTFGVHGSPLNAEQVIETKRKLGYPVGGAVLHPGGGPGPPAGRGRAGEGGGG